MKTANKTFLHQTKTELEFIDITDEIKGFVKECGIKNGLVNIQTMHTTAPLLLNENEPLLIEDIKKNLISIASKSLEYNHNDFTRRTVNMCAGECKNGHSHCQAIHLPSTITLNLIDGTIQIGQWQRIFIIELDHDRPRKYQVMIMGD
jgi:secondary thiamine-phosphate synthase enzyme